MMSRQFSDPRVVRANARPAARLIAASSTVHNQENLKTEASCHESLLVEHCNHFRILTESARARQT
jgi:hypothetical protein